MNRNFLPKPLWSFYHSFPFFWNKEGGWEIQEFPSTGLSIYEDENHVFVEAFLPGIPSDKIKLSFDSGCLSIEGEKKEEEINRKYHKKASSSFYYSTAVPSYIDESKEPEATYKDGVMKVKFFKNGKKKKTIPIKRIS